MKTDAETAGWGEKQKYAGKTDAFRLPDPGVSITDRQEASFLEYQPVAHGTTKNSTHRTKTRPAKSNIWT